MKNSNELRENLEELREIQMKLFRYSSDLDMVIMSIEHELKSSAADDPEFVKLFVLQQRECLNDIKKIRDYLYLDKQEHDAWETFISKL